MCIRDRNELVGDGFFRLVLVARLRGERTGDENQAVLHLSLIHISPLYGNAPRMPHARRVRKHTRRTARGPCFVQAQYMQGVLVLLVPVFFFLNIYTKMLVEPSK